MFRISDRFFLWVSVCIGLLVFALILFRAANLSVTFDESGTFDVLAASYTDVLFAKRFFQSANNHILNSILLKLSASVFGNSELALRLPNVLSYIFYFLGSFIISRECSQNNWIRIMGVVLFSSIVYVLDFFSLARGYGLATGFELFSIAMMILHYKDRKESYLFLTFLFAALSVYSNFTWLNFFVPLWAVYNLLLYVQVNDIALFLKKSLVSNWIPIVLALILFSLSYIPIRYLRMQDEFRWGANGWFDSLHRFASDFLYDHNFLNAVIFQVLLISMVVAASLIIFRTFKLNKYMLPRMRYLFFITSLILMIVLATVVQRNVLGMMYMDGRKALMYFPLVICLLILLLNSFSEVKPNLVAGLSILLIGLSVFNFSSRLKVNSVREWWFDENSREVAYYIHDHPVNGKRDLAVTWYFSESIRYYNQYKLDISIKRLIKMTDREDIHEFAYYYVLGDDIRDVPPMYKPLFRFGWDRILLVKDSMNYNTQKGFLLTEIEGLEEMAETEKSNILDSMLLRQRKEIDWTKIPVTNGDIWKL